jgi:hypothetical protein
VVRGDGAIETAIEDDAEDAIDRHFGRGGTGGGGNGRLSTSALVSVGEPNILWFVIAVVVTDAVLFVILTFSIINDVWRDERPGGLYGIGGLWLLLFVSALLLL